MTSGPMKEPTRPPDP